MPKIKSIRFKILIGFLVIIFTPFSVVGFISIDTLSRELTKEIDKNLLLLAEAKEGQIFTYLGAIKGRTADFASDGYIRDSMSIITKSTSTKAVEDLNHHLKFNKLMLDEALLGIILLDSKGSVVAATDEDEIGEDESGDSYFINGRRGVHIESLLDHDHFGVENAIVVSAPVTDKRTGEFIGVLVNLYNTEVLTKVLSGFYQFEQGALSFSGGQSNTLEVYIVGPDKKIFIHPGVKMNNAKSVFSSKMLVDTIPVQECMANRAEIVDTYYNYEGYKVAGASMCLHELGWTLLVEVKADEAFGAIGSVTSKLLFIIFAIILLIILISYFISSRITQPINELNKGVKKIAQGDLDTYIYIQTNDELGELATDVNEMAKQLKLSRSEIEKEIQARTGNLNTLNKMMVGREQKMIELKEENFKLKRELEKYKK